MTSSDPCLKDCPCTPLCCKISGFKQYAIATGGDLDPTYYASHFDVGTVDDFYHLPAFAEEGQVHILRLGTSSGGRALIDVDHLAGNMAQIQLTNPGNFAELHYKCCQWSLATHEGATCT